MSQVLWRPLRRLASNSDVMMQLHAGTKRAHAKAYTHLNMLVRLCLCFSVTPLGLGNSWANEVSNAPAPAAPVMLEPITVRAAPPNSVDVQRESATPMVVVSRQELEQSSDSSALEVLRRVPGVTVGAVPGKSAEIRVRGLGSDYFQILVDGMRMPPGFSLDFLPPQHIERIEVYKSATVETGARAIAGTINIVLRKSASKPSREAQVAVGFEQERVHPNASWTSTGGSPDRQHSLSLAAQQNKQPIHSIVRTVLKNSSGENIEATDEDHSSFSERNSFSASGRVRLKEGQRLTEISSFLSHMEGSTRGESQMFRRTPESVTNQTNETIIAGQSTALRISGQLSAPITKDWQYETVFAVSQSDVRNRTLYIGRDPAGEFISDERNDTTTSEATLGGKLKSYWPDHAMVFGSEVHFTDRVEDFAQSFLLGDSLSSTAHRTAIYGQDEWSVTPGLTTSIGVRNERIGIRTHQGSGFSAISESNIATPMLHIRWRPQPEKKDQVRMSLTRTYRAPGLSQIGTAPTISRRYPPTGPNIASQPDTASNPLLRPETASSLDLAIEHYLAQEGVISLTLFRKLLSNHIRNVTQLEQTSYAPVERWVSRPYNVGRASVEGIELDAKMRISELMPTRMPIEIRGALGRFHSQVDSVPGPDNRVDRQPYLTSSLGIDYKTRTRGVGMFVAYTPAYRTQTSANQYVSLGARKSLDVYTFLDVAEGVRLRASLTNLGKTMQKINYENRTGTGTESSQTQARAHRALQLRLDAKF